MVMAYLSEDNHPVIYPKFSHQYLLLLLRVIIIDGGPNGHIFVRLNFSKYEPIFKIISLSETGENL